jgi:hypothetical protein
MASHTVQTIGLKRTTWGQGKPARPAIRACHMQVSAQYKASNVLLIIRASSQFSRVHLRYLYALEIFLLNFKSECLSDDGR